MPRTRKPIKVKEPIRLRTKELANGSKSLYLDIYRNGKRTYEYLKMYLIPETDRNARQQNETTMAAANAIKSKRIIELTSGEAGIMNHKDKVYLLDWMQLYKEEQKKRGKKNTGQIKSVTDILKEYAGERFTLNQIDLTFCHGYIDYMLTSYRPKGKPLSASTRNTYYQIFNGALNAAVRAKRILKNPFNEMEKSEKPKMPESVRSYMTIEEVRLLIATPMQNEGVKSAYLFSCFCGLRISDIIGLQWKDVFIDNGQYRLAVAMQKTKEPIYLPLSNEALKWMPERGDKTADDHVFDLPSGINQLIKPWAKAAGISKRFTFHMARHTFATTTTLSKGVPIETVSKMLGHTNIETTQIYARITNSKIGSDMQGLDKKFVGIEKIYKEVAM
ncbi:site-specific integrase [Odoribacter splanchnicus]|uniref:Site-specific integrase n=10 Tax=Bacteroidales TaxID=171549 RepID=A0AAW5CC75_9BACT|nr:site-specific integrase [Odoribacter splanchnicus]MCG4961864.1 site-specific integrase [Odoribacter splanchnicus]MCG5004899.1 site-specific integrase [Odoribacter splanchnicus]